MLLSVVLGYFNDEIKYQTNRLSSMLCFGRNFVNRIIENTTKSLSWECVAKNSSLRVFTINCTWNGLICGRMSHGFCITTTHRLTRSIISLLTWLSPLSLSVPKNEITTPQTLLRVLWGAHIMYLSFPRYRVNSMSFHTVGLFKTMLLLRNQL